MFWNAQRKECGPAINNKIIKINFNIFYFCYLKLNLKSQSTNSHHLLLFLDRLFLGYCLLWLALEILAFFEQGDFRIVFSLGKFFLESQSFTGNFLVKLLDEIWIDFTRSLDLYKVVAWQRLIFTILNVLLVIGRALMFNEVCAKQVVLLKLDCFNKLTFEVKDLDLIVNL